VCGEGGRVSKYKKRVKEGYGHEPKLLGKDINVFWENKL